MLSGYVLNEKSSEDILLTDKNICRHCGGIFKYYRESYTCIFCSREFGHKCDKCLFQKEK